MPRVKGIEKSNWLEAQRALETIERLGFINKEDNRKIQEKINRSACSYHE